MQKEFSKPRFTLLTDDRFVLKEMHKTDVNIFENFAPNYFEYISKCQNQKQLTLLAKIFGVFKVTIKKKECVLRNFQLCSFEIIFCVPYL